MHRVSPFCTCCRHLGVGLRSEVFDLIDVELFACRIASLRHEAGLTQKELAQRCCVTSQAVSKWEHGISCPDILILDELADALHVSLQHLLAGR